MLEIVYAVVWNKRRERTWSGSAHSLYRALQKYAKVSECNLALRQWQEGRVGLSQLRLQKGKMQRRYNDVDVEKKLKSNILKKYIEKTDKNIPVIALEDLQMDKANMYYYQDLSIDSLLWCRENFPLYFEKSGFKGEGLEKRFTEQKKAYDSAKVIFTMSKWLEKNLIEYSGYAEDKVCHVGGGINVDIDKSKNISKTNNKILFVGRDFERKGGYLVYEAFQYLKKKYITNAELYIAGPEQSPIVNLADGVFFLGDLDKDSLAVYYNKCDIMCMPSYFEAYGLVFIEALTYGLPCIGRNAFEMPYLIENGKTGLLIENDNIEQLALAMKELLQNESYKRNVLLNKDKYIKEYSWDTVAQRMMNKIIEVIR